MKRTNFSIELLINIFLIISIPLIVTLGVVFKFENIVTYFFVPFLFLISFHINNYHLRLFKPVNYYILFIFITAFSIVNAQYLDLYAINMKTVLGTLIFGLALYNFVIKDERYLKVILWSYILATYTLAIFFYSQGVLNLSLVYNVQFRLGGGVFDPNSICYYIYLATFAAYLLSYVSNKWWDKYIYIISLPVWTILVLLSGSRGGLAIFVFINIAYWVYIGWVKKINFWNSLLILILLLGVTFPLGTYVYNNYLIHSGIVSRYDLLLKQGANTARFQILIDAYNVFLKHPILGVGAGNYVEISRYHQFSHNNFMEILVNNGVVSFLFYFISLFYFARDTIVGIGSLESVFNKKISAVILLFIFSFVIYSFLYPFFEVISFTGFIFVLFAIIYRLNFGKTPGEPNIVATNNFN